MSLARKQYNELAKYFGLSTRDEYLNGINGSVRAQDGDFKSTPFSNFISNLIDDDDSFENIEKIVDNANVLSGDLNNRICLTTTKNITQKIKDEISNDSSKQGSASKSRVFSIEDCFGTSTSNSENISSIQIFPASFGIDIGDTEITSLFMNSLSSIHLSRAIPFLDIKIVTQKDDLTTADMSLGRFLGVQNGINDPTHASFQNFKLTNNRSIEENLTVVAGMEVFTTPQTLVNADSVKYSSRSGRIDAFRPFMAIKGLEISDTPTGAGTISYKSANLNIVLFDRGRLSDIAPLVSPRRNSNVRFEITYGWSHPDGSALAGRSSDSDEGTRIGKLIDSIKVAESYTLVNTSYSFANDGSVDISLQLTMDGVTNLYNNDVMSLENNNEITNVANLIEEISNNLSNAMQVGGPSIDVPQFLSSGGADGIESIDNEQLKELRSLSSTLMKHKNFKDIGKKLSELVGSKGKLGGALSVVKQQRKAFVEQLISELKQTPDPFLDTKNSQIKNLSNKTYVSYGKLVTRFVASSLSTHDTEVQCIFGAFNHNAGSMFDSNISQFPINLNLLQQDLIEEFDKRNKFTPQQFIRFIAEKYIQFLGSKAYGLDRIYATDIRNKDDQQGKFLASIEKKVSTTAGVLSINQIQFENLNSIYGDKNRVSPTFTTPRVSVRIITKNKKNSENGDKIKKVTRVYVSDVSAGRVMSLSDSLMSLFRKNYCYDESLNGVGNPRSARHGDVLSNNFKILEERNIIKKLEESDIQKIYENQTLDQGQTRSLEDRLRRVYIVSGESKNLKGKQLKNIFFETSPYLIYGSDGSGIIEANLQSEQNDTLTTIFLTNRHSGVGSNPSAVRPDSLPFEVHPATLSLTTFGCPLFHLVQKYFVDMGTGTSVDNFYVVVGITHSFSDSNEFKSSIELKPYDAYGKFLVTQDKIFNAIVQSIVAQTAKR